MRLRGSCPLRAGRTYWMRILHSSYTIAWHRTLLHFVDESGTVRLSLLFIQRGQISLIRTSIFSLHLLCRGGDIVWSRYALKLRHLQKYFPGEQYGCHLLNALFHSSSLKDLQSWIRHVLQQGAWHLECPTAYISWPEGQCVWWTFYLRVL